MRRTKTMPAFAANRACIAFRSICGEASCSGSTRRIRQFDENVKILILTVHEEEDLVAQALEAGACGYTQRIGLSLRSIMPTRE